MHRRSFIAALLLPALLSGARSSTAELVRSPGTAPSEWRIDPAHSEVTFRIRHFVTKVRGRFTDVSGTITTDAAAWEDAAVAVEIRTASISTENARRDAHLRSPDFFAADSFPIIIFRSTRIERRGDAGKIHGLLTMRGVTRPVVLEGRFNGIVRTPDGERAGFEATTTIDRTAFGVTWNRAAEGGGAMLGDDVEVEIVVEAVRRGT
ncbi:MAG TPA: YceI family protein [Gemmatimonadaceae bacterium]|nr:YceI family protein [Gemmatimonadaceae bacterium]